MQSTTFIGGDVSKDTISFSICNRAKTDRADAQLIASYLAEEHAELNPWQRPTPA